MNDEEQLEHEATELTPEEEQQRIGEDHEAWLEMKRQEPVEATSDAEIDAFDAAARRRFETQLVRERYAEPRPGSAEAEAAVRDAIKQGK